MAAPVLSSALSPFMIAWYAVIESRSPAAQEPMPVFTSVKYPVRSLARCDGDGLCDRETTNPPISAAAIAAKTQSGVRLGGHPECRSGTNGGSVCVGVVMRAKSPFH